MQPNFVQSSHNTRRAEFGKFNVARRNVPYQFETTLRAEPASAGKGFLFATLAQYSTTELTIPSGLDLPIGTSAWTSHRKMPRKPSLETSIIDFPKQNIGHFGGDEPS